MEAEQSKRAFILAAGLGTRLGELGQRTPKCLLQAGSETLLSLALENLKRCGVRECVINVHHLGNQVEDYVRAHDDFGIDIHFSREEEEPLETGGALVHARALLKGEGDILIHNGDIFSNCDLSLILKAHRESGAIATLQTMPSNDPRGLLFSTDGELIGWGNQTSGEEARLDGTANLEAVRRGYACIWVMSPRFFEVLDTFEPAKFSIVPAWLRAAEMGHHVREYFADSFDWFDVGTPERLEAFQKYFCTLNQ